MARSIFLCVLILLTAAEASPSACANLPSRPRALLLPITKDISTSQYVTRFKQGTPLAALNLVVDLGSPYTWVACDRGYTSSTSRPVPCEARLCAAEETSPGCSKNNTCIVNTGNTVTRQYASGELSEDAASVQAIDDFSPSSLALTIPNLAFACTRSALLRGLARGVRGIAGLGRAPAALPDQFASAVGLPIKKFTVCLPSSGRGVMFFGDGPYRFLPGVDVAKSLMYTPLLTNPVSTAGVHAAGDKSTEYFINVTYIQVDGRAVPAQPSLLSIDEKGRGGTKISTVEPYTVLESSIHDALLDTFTKMSGLAPVAPVKPFRACYDARNVTTTRYGPGVPTIDLVVDSRDGVWRMMGANSMVRVSPGVLCLAFVDGGRNPTTSVVIGGHQLENVLVQFDLESSRVGFSGTLFDDGTACNKFNFTSVA